VGYFIFSPLLIALKLGIKILELGPGIFYVKNELLCELKIKSIKIKAQAQAQAQAKTGAGASEY
jgi:hypothetical protein